jgi:conjugative transfer region lipoprotein (TIGR03751 family)
MCRIWIDRPAAVFAALSAVASLAGCATTKDELLTHDGQTMLEIWSQETGGPGGGGRASRELLDARQALRRPLIESDMLAAPRIEAAYTRTAQNEIERQFHRLPNPDLLMYVFPHLAGTDPVPVPGYSTVFPFYQRVQYALPGERLEDY